jgi:hypothetical protein
LSSSFPSVRPRAHPPFVDEDLLFVIAEPFDPFLVVVVQDVFSGQWHSKWASPAFPCPSG